VPFGAFQQQTVVSVAPEMRVLVYRRMMVRLAQRIAERVKADALITGEAVGQVASQTLENIRAIDDVATMPILRPLIGSDKEAITTEAKWLGTYDTSIIVDQDCCTLFTPRHPATRASVEQVRQAEALLDIEALATEALSGIVIEEYRYPVDNKGVRSDTIERFFDTQETRS
jgi:thiamine biosynthesis protein ThiI